MSKTAAKTSPTLLLIAARAARGLATGWILRQSTFKPFCYVNLCLSENTSLLVPATGPRNGERLCTSQRPTTGRRSIRSLPTSYTPPRFIKSQAFSDLGVTRAFDFFMRRNRLLTLMLAAAFSDLGVNRAFVFLIKRIFLLTFTLAAACFPRTDEREHADPAPLVTAPAAPKCCWLSLKDGKAQRKSPNVFATTSAIPKKNSGG